MSTEMRTAASVDPARLTAALARIRPVPSLEDDARIDAPAAKRVLRCDDRALAMLVEHGLRVDARTASFSYCDIMNVGLYSGTRRSIPELAERFITRFAAEAPETWTARRRWRLSVEARCTRIGGCVEGRWRLGAPGEQQVRDEGSPGSQVFRADWHARTGGRGMQVLFEPAKELHGECLERFASGTWQYQYLPPGLRGDPHAADALGVMDCFSLAHWLSERLRRAGADVRLRYGLILAFMGVEHAWIEIRDCDGVFKPLDPVLAVLATRSASAARDFRSFTCGSQLNRVLAWPPGAPAIVAHVCNGEQQPVIVLASAVPADRGRG